jgi:Uma2 family endonuclease
VEYWLVDPQERIIEVFELVGGAYILLGKWEEGQRAMSHVLAGFEVAVNEVLG